ncbi:MAG: bidirectional hydrogenase complex protein HoxU [Anaerolineaceae bacterium]|nr:bidirectional hydrogenase complex protein HoxU [Anaerolineaceae bacterium]
MPVKTFKIDGQDVSGREDETVLDIARENNVFLPTLCNIEGLKPVGACRLCMVEVKGSNKLLPACVTKVEEGMEVTTNSERLQKYRRMILEMLFVEGNHVCSVCVANGHCELQWLAEKLGVDHTRLNYMFPKKEIDVSHYRYAIDHNRCVLCTRCVRVCGEIEGAHTWDVSGRGINAKVVTDLNTPWALSETCTECGKCIQVCPTGALFKKSRAVGEMTKDDHFLPYLKTMREVDNAE